MSASGREYRAFLWFLASWVRAVIAEKIFRRLELATNRARFRWDVRLCQANVARQMWKYRVGEMMVDAHVRRRGLQ